MRYFGAIIFALIVAAGMNVSAQTADADREAIKRTALNYAEGWYEGNSDKMESALSPDLAKRIVRTNEYMHIGKFNGKWLIINVLWEMKPKKNDKKN